MIGLQIAATSFVGDDTEVVIAAEVHQPTSIRFNDMNTLEFPAVQLPRAAFLRD
jgi:hypothetical protein